MAILTKLTEGPRDCHLIVDGLTPTMQSVLSPLQL